MHHGGYNDAYTLLFGDRSGYKAEGGEKVTCTGRPQILRKGGLGLAPKRAGLAQSETTFHGQADLTGAPSRPAIT